MEQMNFRRRGVRQRATVARSSCLFFDQNSAIEQTTEVRTLRERIRRTENANRRKQLSATTPHSARAIAICHRVKAASSRLRLDGYGKERKRAHQRSGFSNLIFAMTMVSIR